MPNPREATQMMVCGSCASAPLARERELAHLRCRMEDCRCAQLHHQPDGEIRKSQASFCRITDVQACRRDPGLHDAIARYAAKFAEYGTNAQVAAIMETRHAAHALKDAKPAALRAELEERGVPKVKLKGLDTKKLVALCIEERARHEARTLVSVADERKERLAKATAHIQRNKETDTDMPTKTASKQTPKKASSINSHNGVKVGDTITAPVDLPDKKVKQGDKLTVKEIHQRGSGISFVLKGKNGTGEITVSGKGRMFKQPATKKAAAKKAPAAKKAAAKKAPAKKAVAKKAPAKKAATPPQKPTAAARKTRKATQKRSR